LHDLRRASYPFGVLDVDRLQPHDLAGFGGHEAELIARARSIKAEARAHAALLGPFHLTLTFVPSSAPEGHPGGRDAGPDSRGPAGPSAHDPDGRATARLTDGGGRPVVGAGVAIEAQHAVLDGAAAGPTDADGSFTVAYRLAAATPGQRSAFTAHAIAPDPVPAAYVSSTVRAQRVVRGSWLGLDTPAIPPPTAPTTTSTTSTSTSTTSTTRPTTTTATTSTTGPPRPTVPSTSSTTSTTTPKASTTTSGPGPSTTLGTADTPPSSTPPSTTGGQLPRTGARSAGWALIGAGLVLLGATLVALSRGWAR